MTERNHTSSSPYIVAPEWRTLRVHGPDAAVWLNGIVTCNVVAVEPGRGAWGSLLNKQGKVQADLQIVGEAAELYVGVSGGDSEAVLATLDGYLVMEDAEIETSVLRWIVGAVPPGALASGALPWGEVEPPAAVVEPSHVDDALSSFKGAPLMGPTWDSFRVQHGWPLMGTDYSEADNLHAASLERRTVDWSKGCYLGQEVVCMQDMRGKVKRRLVRLTNSGGASLPVGAELLSSAGEVVGRITSASGAAALGSVGAPHCEDGTALQAGDVEVLVSPLLPG